MPVGGEQLIAGPYTCTWNGAPVGIFRGEEDVPTFVQQSRAQPVESTDRWGRTRIDSVHLGAAYFFQGVLMEYPKALPILWPFGVFGSVLGTIGVLKYQLSKPLVLTAVAGTTASNSPATATAGKTLISDDFDTRIFFGPTVRTVPIKLDVYPYDVGGGVYGFIAMT